MITRKEEMNTLEIALTWAIVAHAGQVDQKGQPYILHVLRVAMAMTTSEARIVAVLHDVVEDSEGLITLGVLAADFSGDVLSAVDALTRRQGEKYTDYILRVRRNLLARQVKLADLQDNLQRDPPGNLGQRYRRAVALLKERGD
jgi:guanosine-3',5'-bis(diphosphate) 3'-pyrophosphohydrolase